MVDEAHNAGYNTQRWLLIKDLVCSEKGRQRHVILLSATPHRGNVLDYLYRLYLLDPYLYEENIKKRKLDNRDFYRLTHGSILYRRTKELVNKIEGKKIFTDCNFYTLAIQPTKDEMKFSHLLVSFLRDKVSSVYEESPSPAALLAVLVRKRASSSPDAAIKTLYHILQGLSDRIGTEEVTIGEEDIESILGIDFGEIEELEKDLDEVVERLVKKCANILDKSDESVVGELIDIANRIKLDDSKLNAIVTIVDKYLKERKKVIVFTEYRDTLEYLKSRFQRLSDKYGDGFFETISGKDKDRFEEVKEKFEGERCNLLIATDVASEGLNLQVANIVINYEAPWSPIKLEQRIGRVWRLGQKEDVNIYTAFMGTDADVDIMQNLYAKLLAMKDALDEVRPLLGETVQIAYRATATASEGLWQAKGVEFAEVEVGEKKEKINEFRLILASLRGTLSQYVASLLYLLSRINEELAGKSVYPYVNPDEVMRNLEKRISTTSKEEYRDYSRKLCQIICRKFGVNTYREEICKGDNMQKIWELIRGELKDIDGRLKAYTFFNSVVEPNNTCYLLLAELKQGEKPVFEEPVLYDRSKEKIIYGVNLLKYLVDLFNNPLIPCPLEFGNQLSLNIEIGEKARIKRKCMERYEDSINGIREYLYKSSLNRYRMNNTDIYKYSVDLKEIAIFMGMETEPEVIPEDIKKRIEEAAMKLVMQIEEKEGRKPSDNPAKDKMPYDIYSYDPNTGEERFIEVKGHAGMQIFGELTEREFEFGKEKGNKYWLYIVFNLTTAGDLTNAKYLRFRDATNTMKVQIKEKIKYILLPI
ncbi:MAG: helicase-related protein [Nitrososphaerales archaeon]